MKGVWFLFILCFFAIRDPSFTSFWSLIALPRKPFLNVFEVGFCHLVFKHILSSLHLPRKINLRFCYKVEFPQIHIVMDFILRGWWLYRAYLLIEFCSVFWSFFYLNFYFFEIFDNTIVCYLIFKSKIMMIMIQTFMW